MATLGEVLLTPTRIYARAILAAREALVASRHGPARPRPHHRRRSAGQRAARPAGRPCGPARPRPLAHAVGHAAVRRPGRDGRRRAARDVQRRARHGRRRAPRRPCRSRSTPSPRHGIDGVARRRGRRGRGSVGGARYVEGPLDGRCGERPHRRRRVGRGLEPAGAARGGRRAASSAGRSSSSSRTGPARRSTGPSEQGIDTALVPGGDDAALADALAACPGRCRRPGRATCGSSVRRCSRPSRSAS